MTSSASWRSTVLRVFLSLSLLAGGTAGMMILGRSRPLPVRPVGRVSEPVEVAVAQPHTAGIEFSVDGVVAPFRELRIAAEATGRIVFKADQCRVGRTVRQGQLLMRIDPRDYEYEVRRLEEELEQAENNLVELDVQVDSAQNQIQLAGEAVAIQNRFLNRLEELARSNATTEADLDTARRNELNSRTSLQTQQDQLRLLQASKRRLESGRERMQTQLSQARIELDRTQVVSPIDGVITEEYAERDSYVQEGTTVFVIRDGSRLDVRCSLQATQMNWLWAARPDRQEPGDRDAYEFPATPVRVVYVVDGERFAWAGVLARYDGGAVDSQTRMIPCRAEVLDPQAVRRLNPSSAAAMASPPTLMVGMFVELQVQVQPRSRLLRLPVSAVRPGNHVWVVEDGRLRRRQVRIATTIAVKPQQEQRGDIHLHPGKVLVYEHETAIVAGDRVVVSPLSSPEEGDEVRVRGES